MILNEHKDDTDCLNIMSMCKSEAVPQGYSFVRSINKLPSFDRVRRTRTLSSVLLDIAASVHLPAADR